ncbi:hypothetical protein J3458_016888 [Metarhizium acridum]|uniref:uncharacterized protein n=1 Tax=Metarhizium acridum TaxID=92637 RepID=UPI001C6ABF10|nr:hypothetical protein J3458_016888 [Metarhizium acridum]
MEPEPPSMPRRKTKRVSVQHTQERVRNNQRRHRARQKDYIASLEQKLIEAERTILTLRNQVEALQTPSTRRCYQTHDQDKNQDDTVHAFEPYSAVSNTWDLRVWDSHVLAPTEPLVSSNQLGSEVNEPISVSPILIAQALELETEPLQGTRHTSDQAAAEPKSLLPLQNHMPRLTATCCSNDLETDLQPTVKTKDREGIVPGQDTPLVMPGYPQEIETCQQAWPYESTIPCSEAYILITQQNFKGIDQGDVAAWLWNGFRRPHQPGEGCRIQTDLLFSLLVFISETSFEVPASMTP